MNTHNSHKFFYQAFENCVSERIFFSEFNQEAKRKLRRSKWGSDLNHSSEIHAIEENNEKIRSIQSIFEQAKKRMQFRDANLAIFYHLEEGNRFFKRSDHATKLSEPVFKSSLVLEASLPEGHRLEYGMDQFDFPKSFETAAFQLIEKLELAVTQYERSECLSCWQGPIVFSEQAAGILIHELLGHLLEEVMVETYHSELKTEKGSLFIHPSLSLYDCPKLKKRFGSFELDDEAQNSQNVCLISGGRLMNFLSRGMGRSRGASTARKSFARMSNTICTGDSTASALHPGATYVEVKRLGLSAVQWKTHQYIFEIGEGYLHDGKGKRLAISKTAIHGSIWDALSQIAPLGEPLHWSSSYCQSLGARISVSHAGPNLFLKKANLRRFKRAEK